MWKIDKNNSEDLNFALGCIYCQAINMGEFKTWLFNVIKDTPVESIPDYIFDLVDFNDSLFHITGVIGFVPHGDLMDEDVNSLYGIAFARGVDVYDSPVTKKNALKALKGNPRMLAEFKRFFPFIDLSDTLMDN